MNLEPALLLFAERSPVDLTLAVLAMIAALAAGSAAVWWLGRRLKGKPPAEAPERQLARYQKLLREGALSQEEFNRIRQSLELTHSGQPPRSAEPPNSGIK